MLKQAEQKTTEQVKEIIIDWKGCGKSEQRQKAIELIEQVGLKYKRTREVEK
jgi:D-tyrosyl-tRNA(Tyr) deacylase